jgi:hypothetical protein
MNYRISKRQGNYLKLKTEDFFMKLRIDNNNKDSSKLITYHHNMSLSKKER